MAVETASLQDRLETWAQRLNNLTVSPLTRDYPDTQKPDSKRAIEAFESLRLPKETQLQLQKLSGSSSGFTVFLTAFVILVARLTGDEDIAVGTSSEEDGRPFVIRVPIDASETFLQLYTKVDKVCITVWVLEMTANSSAGIQGR
jgi:L-aminoadipate-semialdehyde dehydrogenase